MLRLFLPLLSLLLLQSAVEAQEKKEAGWIEMFNGRDFTGWAIDGPKEYKDKNDQDKLKPLWTVTDGLIRTAGNGFGFLRYDRKFDDFEWHVEYRMVKGGNSGLGIRTTVYESSKTTATRPSYYSYEIQLLDDADKKVNPHCTGSLYRYVAPKELANKPAPEWNTVAVTCIGPRIRIVFNGKEVLDVDQSTIAEIKDKPLSGYVCLQSHSKQIEFRHMRIRPLEKK